jgi:hypothetical protein
MRLKLTNPRYEPKPVDPFTELCANALALFGVIGCTCLLLAVIAGWYAVFRLLPLSLL